MISDADKRAKELLRHAQLYSTKARVSIINVLMAAGRPLDKSEIANHLGTEGPDGVTVYRTIESLRSRGIVHRVFAEGRASRYELSHNCGELQCHPHFTCRDCGITQCLTGVRLPLVTGLEKGYKLLRQQVRLEGICPACSSKR